MSSDPRDDNPSSTEDNMSEAGKEAEEEESSSQVVFKEVFDDNSEPTDKGEESLIKYVKYREDDSYAGYSSQYRVLYRSNLKGRGDYYVYWEMR